MANPERRWRPRPAVFILLAAEVGAFAWVWATARGTTESFPQSLLTAEGLLLTALVFFLGLGQGNLRRVGEGVIADLRQLEKTLRDSYQSDSRPMPTFRLIEWAATISNEAKNTKECMSLSEARNLYSRYASLERTRDAVENSALDLYRIDRELRGDHGGAAAPEPRRREYLEREERKLETQRRETLTEMQDIERKTGVTGEAVLSGRLLLGVGSTSNLLTLGFGFVSVMALLAAIGITYSGWGTTGSPRPEWWAVAALLGLAISYAIILSVDIQRESKATLAALETSWLASLYGAEQTLSALGQSGHYSPERRKELLRRARVLLQMAERADPTFPWLQSLRGRAELYEAVAAAEQYSRALEVGSTDADARWYADSLERHLLLAEPLLQQGARRKDDPVAGVALAKALELTATLGRDGTGRHRARADILVGLAASQFGTQRLDGSIFVPPVHGPSVAWTWLDQQVWLWPTDEQREQVLASLDPRRD